MAKQTYKIPTSIDASVLDQEVNLVSNDNAQVQPVKVRTIVLILVSFILGAVLLYKFLWLAGFVTKAVFFVSWVSMTMLLMTRDKTGEEGFLRVQALFSYLDPANRRTVTRRSASIKQLFKLLNIRDINEEGVISFNDGTVGLIYSAVGNASALLFENDQRTILDSADVFYQTLDTKHEIITITSKSSQNVDLQIAAMNARYKRRNFDSPELIGLLKTSQDALKHDVGDRFKSINQAIILKTDSMESLLKGNDIIIDEYESTGHVFKSLTRLDTETDIIRELRIVYGDGSVNRK